MDGQPDYSRLTLKTRRGYRPTQTNTPTYITLTTAKALLAEQLNIFPKTIIDVEFIKTNCCVDNLNEFMYSLICLHFNIMFKKDVDVLRFLKKYCDHFGCSATQLLINYCYQDNITAQFSTNSTNALAVAALWSNEPTIFRILYKFGCDVGSIYQNGLFAEELHTYIPYYNHFSQYIGYKSTYSYNHIWGYRLVNDFTDQINEIKIVCGEIAVPKNYTFPEKSSYLVGKNSEYINYEEENNDTVLEQRVIDNLQRLSNQIQRRRRLASEEKEEEEEDDFLSQDDSETEVMI